MQRRGASRPPTRRQGGTAPLRRPHPQADPDTARDRPAPLFPCRHGRDRPRTDASPPLVHAGPGREKGQPGAGLHATSPFRVVEPWQPPSSPSPSKVSPRPCMPVAKDMPGGGSRRGARARGRPRRRPAPAAGRSVKAEPAIFLGPSALSCSGAIRALNPALHAPKVRPFSC